MPAFLPDAATLAAFAVAALVLTFTPGPDMTLFLGKTLTQGRAAGFAALCGAATGLLVHTLLAAFGLSALLAASPAAFGVVKIAGALYLAWLAIDTLRNGSALTLDNRPQTPQGWWTVYSLGLGVNLLNPKIVLFFVTFLPQFVQAGDPDAAMTLFALGIGFQLIGFPCCAAMILGADRLSAFFRRSRLLMRAFDWACATLFGSFAVKILLARA